MRLSQQRAGVSSRRSAAAGGALPTVWRGIRNRDTVAILRALQEHADIEEREYGLKPLMVAAQQGDVELMELLLAHGADIAGTGRHSESCPLHLAAQGGHVAAVKCLLRHGADSDQRDYRGRDALSISASLGHLPVMRALIEHITRTRGTAALQSALPQALTYSLQKRDNTDAARLLLEEGVDLQQLTPFFRTFMTWAATAQDGDAVLFLRQCGAPNLSQCDLDWLERGGLRPRVAWCLLGKVDL